MHHARRHVHHITPPGLRRVRKILGLRLWPNAEGSKAWDQNVVQVGGPGSPACLPRPDASPGWLPACLACPANSGLRPASTAAGGVETVVPLPASLLHACLPGSWTETVSCRTYPTAEGVRGAVCEPVHAVWAAQGRRQARLLQGHAAAAGAQAQHTSGSSSSSASMTFWAPGTAARGPPPC